MKKFVIALSGLFAGMLVAAAAGAATNAAATASPHDPFAQRMLAIHNQERASVGAPPLLWDPALAEAAASYGPDLERMGRLAHSPRETRPGQRENLAMASSGHFPVDFLIGLWVAEKKLFQPGVYPHVSRTGYWKDVSHYTQMIWKETTHVGCALHRGGGNDFLICRYTPPGNRDGRTLP